MRKFIFIIALFLTFTPTLACAMPLCPSMEPANEQAPCHDVDANSATMLMLDCMGLDLFHSDVNYDDALDVPMDGDHIAWDFSRGAYNSLIASAHKIRGPPPRGAGLNHNIPTYLYTQRLRI